MVVYSRFSVNFQQFLYFTPFFAKNIMEIERVNDLHFSMIGFAHDPIATQHLLAYNRTQSWYCSRLATALKVVLNHTPDVSQVLTVSYPETLFTFFADTYTKLLQQ